MPILAKVYLFTDLEDCLYSARWQFINKKGGNKADDIGNWTSSIKNKL